jgi:hypothetical protein
MKRDRPKAVTCIHFASGLKSLSLEKSNALADRLENQFTPHDLYEEKHERRMEDRLQALFEAMDDGLPKNV